MKENYRVGFKSFEILKGRQNVFENPPSPQIDSITEETTERKESRTRVIFFAEAFKRHLIKYQRDASHESEDLWITEKKKALEN